MSGAVGTHSQAWFANFVDDGVLVAHRYLHPLEARTYRVQAAGAYEARMPYDVRNWELGWYFTVWNTSNSDTLACRTYDGVAITNGLLLPVSIGHVILTDNSTAYGTWRMFQRGAGAGPILT